MPIPSGEMHSQIKFMTRRDGCMPEYETGRYADLEVEHSSYCDLWSKLRRPDWVVICICQGNLYITEASYSQLEKGKRIIVLYIPMSGDIQG